MPTYRFFPVLYLKLGTGAYRLQSHRTCHFGKAFSPRAIVLSATTYVYRLRRRTLSITTATAYNKLQLGATKLAHVPPQYLL